MTHDGVAVISSIISMRAFLPPTMFRAPLMSSGVMRIYWLLQRMDGMLPQVRLARFGSTLKL
jgi:hypothetical protein